MALLLRDIQSTRLAKAAVGDKQGGRSGLHNASGGTEVSPSITRSSAGAETGLGLLCTVDMYCRMALQLRGLTDHLNINTALGTAGASLRRLQPSASVLRRLHRAEHRTVIIAGELQILYAYSAVLNVE